MFNFLLLPIMQRIKANVFCYFWYDRDFCSSCLSSSKDATTHIGSIGMAIPEGKLSLVDENGQEIVTTDTEGELKYEGPNVTMGYGTCMEDLLKGDEFCGTYFTGDIAKMDSDGYFYIVGRKKRFLKLFGLRVSLDQCEKIIKDSLNIECVCTGDDQQMRVYITDESLKDDVKSSLPKNRAYYKMF